MSTNVTSVLNDLIETSRDGEQGFRKSAEHAKDATVKTLFTTRADDCARAVSELQALVVQLGGKPETSGSISGALHRGWTELKASVSSDDDLALLQECERGEDVAKKRYRQALDSDLPADVRAIIERQYQGVVSNHDRVRDLRDQYAARAK
ncbi:PA2169 family four-helix-bundle protein [Chitinasiproducens palmae]|uniref:DUF2383 domain-containing protein n=1 Tax=Chitinasiproducens palmae TaxID=1770053 RepID=A0A1H2PM98_9BURK|nr:PA2169 family four-helix-bundle protein [Chitinasiproducens palmae]SDV47708.1 conserved hypothetical protein [Chitinasiproducens palmae]